jgi:hypothetical protein
LLYQQDSIGANKQLFISPDAFIYRHKKEVMAFLAGQKFKGFMSTGIPMKPAHIFPPAAKPGLFDVPSFHYS